MSSISSVSPQPEGRLVPTADATADATEEARLLGVIVQLVQQATQVDVSHYKDSTFRRQLDRRLLELGLSDLGAYVDWLARDPQELQRLQQSLLISVTRFFRDPEVFGRLAEVLAEMVAAKPDGEGLRLWVPGCATGEEAYTIAILVAEALGERLQRCPVRLFATDIDQHAIRHARQGLYPSAVLDDLPPGLAERYFVPDEGGVRPAKFIRDLCVFAQHDLLSQPPFVNLDLVSCRNVLIYFQADMQAAILGKFHHALRPQGCLLLGQSESVGGHDGLYEGLDKHFKVFRRRAGPSPRVQNMASQGRAMEVAALARIQTGPAAAQETRFHQQLLKRHAPPSALVDLSGRVLHLWGDVGLYLRLEGGSADFSLPSLCLPALRNEVKTLMHLAANAQPGAASEALLTQRVEVQRGKQRTVVRLTAQPVWGDLGEVLGVVIGFDDRAVAQGGAGPARDGPQAQSDQDAREQLADEAVDADRQDLREELSMARERLHALVQLLDQAQDERQSLNEELQASSEELQSSNEELQASNEELTTLNEQLMGKSEELGTLNEVLLNIERSMQMAMVVVDPQLRVLRFNPLAVRIFGLLTHDVGRPLHSVPCSLPLDALPQQIGAVLASGEALVTRVDQAERHYVMQISPLHDSRGALAGVILTFTDVAELRVAETERSRLAAIVTSSDDAIIGKTLSGIITSWNPGAQRLFGYTAEEAVGQPMLITFPPEAQAEEAMLLACIARGEPVAAFDTVRVRKDGSRVPVSVALSPIRDGDGQIVGVSKIARDITERVADEAVRSNNLQRLEQLVQERTSQLAEKERYLQSILEGMPGLVAYWDADLRLQYSNQQHRLRLSRDKVNGDVGHTMQELLGPERFARASVHVERVLKGELVEFEMAPLKDPSREGISYFQVNYMPDVRDGQVVGFIAMGFDITTVKHAEMAAEAANRAKSEFLANMSHEIRTPLNAVLGLAQVAQRQHGDEPVAETFAHILQAGQHLLSVINDILDFSKIEAGKLELQIGHVDITELIDKAVGMVAEMARSKGLSLRVSRDPDLADAFAGDPTRLAQLLINLLTNAVKFTDTGRVELLMQARDGGVAMVVSDTGQGMSPKVIARLFTPFEQGDGSTTRRVGGTGLGLSICKRLVDLMNGRIQVDSQPGKGSRFEVWLPLRPLLTRTLDAALAPLASSASAWPLGEPRLRGVRVLVAEDHPVNQMVMQQLLEFEGAELVLVNHGGLAVDAVRQHPERYFDLVLCDIEMPVMDGYEATRQICALAPHLPVVGLTAHAFEDARRRGEEAGMSGYVTKPYVVDALVMEIRRHLAPERLQQLQREQGKRGLGSEPAPKPSLARLDPAALAAHYRTVPGFVPRLFGLVREACESQPALLTEALLQGQGARLRYLAHGVAGMAANLLLPDLRAVAHRLEVAAELDLDAAAALVGEVNEALAELCEQLDAEMSLQG
jgi:two-component system CheB/CheR fusion protein